jgi:hypothetical protein
VRSGSKADGSSNDAETSTCSSPIHRAGSNVVDQIDEYHQLRPHALQTNHEHQGYNAYSNSALSPPERSTRTFPFARTRTDSDLAPMSGLSYDYHQNFDASSGWDHSPYLSHSPQNLAIDRSNAGDASSTWGRPTGSPIAGAYAPSLLSMHSSSMSMTPSSQGSREAFLPHGARDDRNWQPPSTPMRSMSLVTPEEMPPHYQARFLHQSPVSTGPAPVTAGLAIQTPYNHAFQDAASCMPQASAGMTVLGHHDHTGQQLGFAYPQWNNDHQPGTQILESGAEVYAAEWYHGPQNLAQVPEEDISHHAFQLASRSSRHR